MERITAQKLGEHQGGLGFRTNLGPANASPCQVTDELSFIRVKILSMKDMVKRMKRPATDQKKILTNTFDKRI